jgi:hypothetical protein
MLRRWGHWGRWNRWDIIGDRKLSEDRIALQPLQRSGHIFFLEPSGHKAGHDNVLGAVSPEKDELASDVCFGCCCCCCRCY